MTKALFSPNFRDLAPALHGAFPRRPSDINRRGLRGHGSPVSHPHRTIFISDVHLGTRGCKADALADFLARNSCQTLFLVGDIVDGWRLKRRWFWPEAHSRVVREILHKVDSGTRVLYLNDGDWVESCTALVEDSRGTLEILRWPAFGDSKERGLFPEPVGEIAALAA